MPQQRIVAAIDSFPVAERAVSRAAPHIEKGVDTAVRILERAQA